MKPEERQICNDIILACNIDVLPISQQNNNTVLAAVLIFAAQTQNGYCKVHGNLDKLT